MSNQDPFAGFVRDDGRTMRAYFTVVIPWSDRPTEWHPTERTGPFATLTRGAFRDVAGAEAWAGAHLRGAECQIRGVYDSGRFPTLAMIDACDGWIADPSDA